MNNQATLSKKIPPDACAAFRTAAHIIRDRKRDIENSEKAWGLSETLEHMAQAFDGMATGDADVFITGAGAEPQSPSEPRLSNQANGDVETLHPLPYQAAEPRRDERELAVTIVDGLLGYTVEFSNDKAAHAADYDLVEGILKAARASAAPLKQTEQDIRGWVDDFGIAQDFDTDDGVALIQAWEEARLADKENAMKAENIVRLIKPATEWLVELHAPDADGSGEMVCGLFASKDVMEADHFYKLTCRIIDTLASQPQPSAGQTEGK